MKRGPKPAHALPIFARTPLAALPLGPRRRAPPSNRGPRKPSAGPPRAALAVEGSTAAGKRKGCLSSHRRIADFNSFAAVRWHDMHSIHSSPLSAPTAFVDVRRRGLIPPLSLLAYHKHPLSAPLSYSQALDRDLQHP